MSSILLFLALFLVLEKNFCEYKLSKLPAHLWKQWTKSQVDMKCTRFASFICLNTLVYVKWNRIPTSYSGRPKRSTKDMHTPLFGLISLIFMQFSAKNWPNSRLASPLWEMLDPPLTYPWTVFTFSFVPYVCDLVIYHCIHSEFLAIESGDNSNNGLISGQQGRHVLHHSDI